MTVAEARAADQSSGIAFDVLVERAGAAVATEALHMMGGAYGRRVAVVWGKGSNGADGLRAAARLRRAGAGVACISADAPAQAMARPISEADLIIDAAYGTGGRPTYEAPAAAGVPVLAVDIPSGVDADTGIAGHRAVQATTTVTFVALKPGLLLGDGPDHAGRVVVADIGIRAGDIYCHVVDDGDVRRQLLARSRQSHKWNHAVTVVAGSPGMMGAARLASTAAMRAGAGMVRLCAPGSQPHDFAASEVVGRMLPSAGWAEAAVRETARAGAVVAGPGLGSSVETSAEVRRFVCAIGAPLVLDADGLNAIDEVEVLLRRPGPTVLTPHDGEFERLAGSPPGDDRIAAARTLAERTHCVVLLKGPTTVVAAPDGEVRLAAAGSARLATAGTGDVLAGVVGAFLARGLPPLEAAALAAHVHGRAADRGRSVGLVAGDLPALVADELSSFAGGANE